jgi:hypothetical protein
MSFIELYLSILLANCLANQSDPTHLVPNILFDNRDDITASPIELENDPR